MGIPVKDVMMEKMGITVKRVKVKVNCCMAQYQATYYDSSLCFTNI